MMNVADWCSVESCGAPGRRQLGLLRVDDALLLNTLSNTNACQSVSTQPLIAEVPHTVIAKQVAQQKHHGVTKIASETAAFDTEAYITQTERYVMLPATRHDGIACKYVLCWKQLQQPRHEP